LTSEKNYFFVWSIDGKNFSPVGVGHWDASIMQEGGPENGAAAAAVTGEAMPTTAQCARLILLALRDEMLGCLQLLDGLDPKARQHPIFVTQRQECEQAIREIETELRVDHGWTPPQTRQ
jgi:hypothetical protein